MAVRLVVRALGAPDGSAEVIYELDQDRVVLGRGAGADVRLPHRTVSEQHATLSRTRGSYALVDESSTNGTRVNGARLAPGRAKALRSGDVVEMGGFRIAFEERPGAGPALPAERTAALARRLVREVLDPAGAGRAAMRLVVLGGPQDGATLDIPAPPARLSIGRGDDCDLALQDADCSREHVELVRDLDGVVARDLGSKNGLRVNDRVVTERRLRDRDELLVGATVLLYEDPAEAAVRALEGLADERLPELPTPPTVSAPAAPEPAPEPMPVPVVARVPAPRRDGTTRSRSAETIVIAVAVLVLAASTIALYFLFRF